MLKQAGRGSKLRPACFLRGFHPEGVGQHSPGQRPGLRMGRVCTLKGCDNARLTGVAPLQGAVACWVRNPGRRQLRSLALGYVVTPLRGENQNPLGRRNIALLETSELNFARHRHVWLYPAPHAGEAST